MPITCYLVGMYATGRPRNSSRHLPFLPPQFLIKQDKICTLPWQLDRITAASVGSGAAAVATAEAAIAAAERAVVAVVNGVANVHVTVTENVNVNAKIKI